MWSYRNSMCLHGHILHPLWHTFIVLVSLTYSPEGGKQEGKWMDKGGLRWIWDTGRETEGGTPGLKKGEGGTRWDEKVKRKSRRLAESRRFWDSVHVPSHDPIWDSAISVLRVSYCTQGFLHRGWMSNIQRHTYTELYIWVYVCRSHYLCWNGNRDMRQDMAISMHIKFSVTLFRVTS